MTANDPSAPPIDTVSAPVAPRRPVRRSHHGDDVDDPYEWLRAKDDPAVIAHLEAENAYTRARTAHLATLRDRIFAEIKGRTLETDL
ncbi:MAG TPA: oligopeptidase B, partial [Microbacterium sp.]|nr:oligopeptidase B [Microbacterium sp.]